MNVEIKFGTRKELRAWLHRQKKSGNAVRYVAVDDPKTDQRMMLVLKDQAQKKRLIAEINRNFETGQEKCLDLQIIDSQGEETSNMDDMAFMKKTLREQLQLLAERSREVTEVKELSELTGAMVFPVSQLTYFAEQEQQRRTDR